MLFLSMHSKAFSCPESSITEVTGTVEFFSACCSSSCFQKLFLVKKLSSQKLQELPNSSFKRLQLVGKIIIPHVVHLHTSKLFSCLKVFITEFTRYHRICLLLSSRTFNQLIVGKIIVHVMLSNSLVVQKFPSQNSQSIAKSALDNFCQLILHQFL